MKILQVVQKPQRRGAEIFAFQLSQELRHQGHEVRIAYLYPHDDANALPLHPTDCMLAGQERHPLEKSPGFHPLLLKRVIQQINNFKPDVVQVNGARTIKYGALAQYFCRHQSWVLVYRNIGNPNDWVLGRRRQLFYSRLIMPKLDGVVGVSQTTLDNLTNFYALTIPTTHIPRGIDPKALNFSLSRDVVRAKTQTPPLAPLILFVGSLTPEKRLDRLLRAVRQILSHHLPDLQVWIMGGGPLRPELEKQVESLGLNETVHFLGVQADVATYMQAADLLALTSDTEGLPGVILEAGWLELPAVATRVGGVSECVLDNETGLLVEPDDEDGLVQAMLSLLQYPEQRATMGGKAKSWIGKNFTIEKISQKYVDFYQQVLTN